MFYSFENERRQVGARTRFILVAPARSGSTLLRTTLNAHPQITCHGEVLSQHVLGWSMGAMARPTADEFRRIRARDLLGFSEQYIYRPTKPVTGFKLLYSHPRIDIAELFEALVEDRAVRTVHLWRRDLVARYISNFHHADGRDIGGRYDDASGEYVLDPVIIAQDCRNQMATARQLHRQFGRHPSHALEYETLVKEPAPSLDAIADFLGVTRGRMSVKPAPSMEQRQSSGSRFVAIANLDEVKASPLLQPYRNIAWSEALAGG